MRESDWERRVLELLASNDEEAYRHLYEQLYAPLCLFAGHYVADNELGADFVQEVFISLLGAGIRFREMNQLKVDFLTFSAGKGRKSSQPEVEPLTFGIGQLII